MKYGIILVLLISILPLVGCSSDLLPSILASDTQAVVEDVKDNSDDVFDEIQRNIDMVANLKGKVQEAQISGKAISLNSIVKDIEAITKSYEKLAGQREGIKKGILRKIVNIEKMRTTVQAEITILRQKQADYTEQLRMVNDPDPEIARTRKKALSKAIEYVDAQIHLWTEFNNIQGDIIVEMSDIQQRIDRFLSMIESSAILFREGLNLLHLQRDINEAIALFASDLPRMEQLSQDMEKSWDNLDYLIETLTGIANIKIAK